jgi:hypothetical protein
VSAFDAFTEIKNMLLPLLLHFRATIASVTPPEVDTMKNLFAALAVALTFATQAFAQSAPPAPDAVTLKAATEMLEAMNFRATTKAGFVQMRAAIPVMMKQAATAAINNNPRLDATQKLTEINKLDGEVQKRASNMDSLFDDPTLVNEIMQNTAVMYARHYTVAEMRQIAAFYKSPVGAKMLATAPQMMGETMQMSQSLIMPRLDALMKQMQAGRAGQ